MLPFYGTMLPLYGTMLPFYGTMLPFYGTGGFGRWLCHLIGMQP